MISACPLCGADSTLLLSAAQDRNRRRTPDSWPYRRCARCKTVFNAEPPTDLGPYYAGRYHGFDDAGRPAWRGNETLQGFESHRVKLLQEYVEPGSLIEIGAGAGGFAYAASRAGFTVSAIEMDANCCRYLSGFAAAIHSDNPLGALATLPTTRVVVMWHVLEHLPNPAEVLAAAAGKIEPGGVLAIGVPNPDSLQFRVLRGRWAHLDAPRHLCLIPPQALADRAAALGLELLLQSTSDPFGRDCNRFGWECALRANPSDQPAPRRTARLARALTAVAQPLERARGSAVTMLFRAAA